MEEKTMADNLGGQLILRDRLAENRTALANERTLLSYVRTALALFAAGVSFINFFRPPIIIVIGWIFIPIGAYLLLKGIASFRRVNRLMRVEEKEELVKKT